MEGFSALVFQASGKSSAQQLVMKTSQLAFFLSKHKARNSKLHEVSCKNVSRVGLARHTLTILICISAFFATTVLCAIFRSHLENLRVTTMTRFDKELVAILVALDGLLEYFRNIPAAAASVLRSFDHYVGKQ